MAPGLFTAALTLGFNTKSVNAFGEVKRCFFNVSYITGQELQN